MESSRIKIATNLDGQLRYLPMALAEHSDPLDLSHTYCPALTQHLWYLPAISSINITNYNGISRLRHIMCDYTELIYNCGKYILNLTTSKVLT